MRLWFDTTAPAHPLVFRPVIEHLRREGHEVFLTARDYAQNLGVLDRLGLEYTSIGAHGGESWPGKLRALGSRSLRLRRHVRSLGPIDLAVAHGSNDLAVVAKSLRIPAVNMFDYEFAKAQHNLGCRLARRVMVPAAIAPERLRPYGVGPSKLVQYEGLKEEYYLSDFAPDPAALDALGVDRERTVVIVRPPPDVSLYHRMENPLFPRILERLGRAEDVHAVVIPRTAQQRDDIEGLRLPSLIVCREAVDAQSLIAQADLVVSAGGTMNREAVALGTPVYTVFEGRMGGVDEWLIGEGRLRPLTDEHAIELRKHREERTVMRRDPGVLAGLILGTIA